MATDMIKIDASSMASIDFGQYLFDYYSNLGTTIGANKFYGGEFTPGPGLGYLVGSQVGVQFAGTVNDALILMEGADMQYDGRLTPPKHGSYSGDVDSVTFGFYNGDTVIPEGDNVNPRDLITGIVEGLKISNLDISEEVGAGTGPDNAFYQLMNALRRGVTATGDEHAFIDQLYDIFGAKAQHFIGSEGNDTYTATKFNDKVIGGAGDDTLDGGKGDDKIQGGKGLDTLTGGKGDDIFLFKAGDSADSPHIADTIADFNSKQDIINLAKLDANEDKNGNQRFEWIGDDKFSGEAGELRYVTFKNDTYITADTDGDKWADFALHLDHGMKLNADSFVL